jgi:hypothetical protein
MEPFLKRAEGADSSWLPTYNILRVSWDSPDLEKNFERAISEHAGSFSCYSK